MLIISKITTNAFLKVLSPKGRNNRGIERGANLDINGRKWRLQTRINGEIYICIETKTAF